MNKVDTEKHKQYITELLRRYAAATLNSNKVLLQERILEASEGLVLALVTRFVRRFHINFSEVDDLKQAARIAVWNCIPRYDPTRNLHFTTYAGESVKGAVYSEHTRVQRLIHAPNRYFRLNLESADASATTDIFNRALMAWQSRATNLLEYDEDTTSIDAVNPQQEAAVLVREILHASTELFTKRNGAILVDYLQGVSTSELGRKYGFTRAWADQLPKQLLLKLRKHFDSCVQAPTCRG